MPAPSLEFQSGKVYCVGLRDNNEEPAGKRLVRYCGPGEPWEDICSGEPAAIERAHIAEAIEVPLTVVDAIKLAQDKRSMPFGAPSNDFLDDDDDADPWESDLYCDDIDN